MSLTVKMAKRPLCDFCRHGKKLSDDGLAQYDAKTKDGPWAYMCRAHYGTYGFKLGTGWGQRILLEGEEYED